jgi:hypothetical protein
MGVIWEIVKVWVDHLDGLLVQFGTCVSELAAVGWG